MANKKKKKVDIRKKRAKLLKERQKKLPKEQLKEEKKKSKSKSDFDIRIEQESKLYWARGITGALSALVGRLFLGLIGLQLLFWMLFFWFAFPFITNKILKYEYKKDEWTWKNVIKPGIGAFFFLFMMVGIFIHTLLKLA